MKTLGTLQGRIHPRRSYRAALIGAGTIYHDAEHPSELVLPVIKAD